MKCDELKPLMCAHEPNVRPMYDKSEVDAAIAELKQFAEDACLERDDNQNSIDELQEENRRLKRALWIARAKRVLEKIAWFKLWNTSISTMNPEDGARREYDKWKKSLGKFLKKAEEYK